MAEVPAGVQAIGIAPVTETELRASVPSHRRNLAWLSGSQVTTWVITLVWTCIVPRRLGPSAWGMLVTASAIGGILGVLVGYGTRNYIVREIVRAPGRTKEILATAVTLRLLLFAPAALALLLTLRLTGFAAEQTTIVVLGSLVVYLTLLAEPFQGLFQAVEHMQLLAATTLVDKLGQCAAAILLVMLGFGVFPVAVSWVAVTLVLLGLNVFWARRFVHLTLRTDVPKLRAMAIQSLPYWTMGLFLTFYVWVDSAMLSVMTSDTVVGWYGVPTRLFGTLLVVATIMSTAWLPKYVTAFQRGEHHLRSIARGPSTQLLILSLPIAIGGAVVAGPLIKLLYGSAYDAAAPVMVVLSVCVLPLYVNIVAQQLLIASRREAVWARVMAGATVVNPIMNFYAIRLTQDHMGNGAVGAALSLLATELLIAAVSVAVVIRHVIDREAFNRVLRGLLAALTMGGCVYLTRGTGLFGEIGVGVVTFTVLALVLRVPTDAERTEARQTIARLVARVRA
jgi:O-antigen/teichoic acid export membrane protein